MSLETLFSNARHQRNPIGKMEMGKMYEPRLTREEAMTLPWADFRDRLKPMVTVPITSDLEISLVDKNTLWAPSDLCGFLGGNKDIFTLEDLTSEEGIAFLRFHYLLAKRVREQGNIHRDQYRQIHVVLGFNPEDFQLGTHSIKRLHTHIYTPYHWITDGRVGNIPQRQIVGWKKLGWFDRLKFYEPFSSLHFDFIKDQLAQGMLKDFLASSEVENNNGYVSLYLRNNANFPSVFPQLQQLYAQLHKEYSLIENIFTDRSIDHQTGRLIPREPEERERRLSQYLSSQSSWLSSGSEKLLRYLAVHLQPASKRQALGVINSAQEVWITKGFAGTILFDFDQTSKEIRLDIFPRVITTSAPEKAVHGRNRPTLIERSERSPSPYERLEREKFYGFVVGTVNLFNDWQWDSLSSPESTSRAGEELGLRI